MSQLRTESSNLAVRNVQVFGVEVGVNADAEYYEVEATIDGSGFGEDATDLATGRLAWLYDEQVVRPLYPDLCPEVPERLRDAYGGGLGNTGRDMDRYLWSEHEREPEPARRRAPSAPEPSPAALLGLGDHERPMWSTHTGQRTRPLLGRADLLVEVHLLRQWAPGVLDSSQAQPAHPIPISPIVATPPSTRAAAWTTGTARRPPVPSPRRICRSRIGSRPRCPSATAAPGSTE